jgi:hypothetical protein
MQRARALVLEDNRRELDELASTVAACGLTPMATSSPAQASRFLRQNVPAVAVIDWNMENSPDLERTSESVLRLLAVRHPSTWTVVYAANTGDLRLQERVAAAHPSALLHDKLRGNTSLRTRLVKPLTQTIVGDLQLDRGSVVHIPSGDRFSHVIALDLMSAQTRPRGMQRTAVAERRTDRAQAIWRFQRWLQAHDSVVSVAARGAGHYELVAPPTPVIIDAADGS